MFKLGAGTPKQPSTVVAEQVNSSLFSFWSVYLCKHYQIDYFDLLHSYKYQQQQATPKAQAIGARRYAAWLQHLFALNLLRGSYVNGA